MPAKVGTDAAPAADQADADTKPEEQDATGAAAQPSPALPVPTADMAVPTPAAPTQVPGQVPADREADLGLAGRAGAGRGPQGERPGPTDQAGVTDGPATGAASPADGAVPDAGTPLPGTAAGKAQAAPGRAMPRQLPATEAGQSADPSTPGAPGIAGRTAPEPGHAAAAHATAPAALALTPQVRAEADAAPQAAPAVPALPALALPAALPLAAPGGTADTGQTQGTEATRSAPAAQVAPALVQLATAPGGAQSMVLRLDPLELGRVEIRVDRSADGPAAVQLTVERPDTLMLLLRDQTALHKALDQAGLPADRTVQFHLGPPASGSADAAPPAVAPPSPSSGGGGMGTDPGGDGRGAWGSGSAAGNGGGQAGGQGNGQNQGGWGRRAAPEQDRPATGTTAWLRAGINITA